VVCLYPTYQIGQVFLQEAKNAGVRNKIIKDNAVHNIDSLKWLFGIEAIIINPSFKLSNKNVEDIYSLAATLSIEQFTKNRPFFVIFVG
jgi:23S rRNA A2030 N6-methylase RlmJ